MMARKTDPNIYEPREDSYLLAKSVQKLAKGKVLDMGAGSGIQAIEAAKNKSVTSVLAADIQTDVIDYNRKNLKDKIIINKGQLRKIRFIKSDLFKNIITDFDTIIFNPPYLPNDKKDPDITLDGGKHGHEILVRFINNLNDYMTENGIALILFSSKTNVKKIDGALKDNLLHGEMLSKQHVFFEDLYVYKLTKSNMLKRIQKEGIKKIAYLTKGNRGLLFTGTLNRTKVAIKLKEPNSKAIGRIQNEIRYLKFLNKNNIGPKLLIARKDFFVYRFVEGQPILDYIKDNSKEKIKKVIKNILNQCYTLDSLNINKEEMHHPAKHIIIKNKPVMIDFERCYKTQKPQNLTQFCQFIIWISQNKKYFKVNKENIIELAKKYRKDMNKNIIPKILVEIR